MRCILPVVLSIIFAVAPVQAQSTPEAVISGQHSFTQNVITTGLEAPWELTWGPDSFLWVTERVAGRITRVNVATGEKIPAIEIGEVSVHAGQDGILGMALHPELLQGTGNDYIYAAYTYVDEALGPVETVIDPDSPFRFVYAKIVRLTYNPANNQLSEPFELIAGLPAGADHNSGRMKIGPDRKLYYTIGDMGNDQLANFCTPIESQTLPSTDQVAAKDYFAYQGKALRLNLDGSIPNDNPLIMGVRSHVFTYGHRNMQGIDFAPDGTLYTSEQGPKTDDEINILTPGTNYGWPHIAGFKDDKAYQYARWPDASVPCSELIFSDIDIHPSVPVADETAWPEAAVDPIATLFTVPNEWDFTDPVCGGMDFICWPTIAASSIETYMPGEDGIKGWQNALLVTALKRGSVYKIGLKADGKTLDGPIERYFRTQNRYRDIAVSPDRMTIYVATDPWGLTEAINGGPTTDIENPGSILAFTYNGDD